MFAAIKNLLAPAAVKKSAAEPLPEWMTQQLRLPPWARVAETHSSKVSICIDVDTDGYVQEWLRLLDVSEPDQYWLEVAYQCAKLDVQMALAGTEYDPRFNSMPAEFHFSRAPEWALARYKHGRGMKAATEGKEARGHYARIRGRMPF